MTSKATAIHILFIVLLGIELNISKDFFSYIDRVSIEKIINVALLYILNKENTHGLDTKKAPK